MKTDYPVPGACRRNFEFTFDVGDTDCVTVEYHEQNYSDGGRWLCTVIDGDGERCRHDLYDLPYGVLPDIGHAEHVATEFLKYQHIKPTKTP